jgi:hypothetical protein
VAVPVVGLEGSGGGESFSSPVLFCRESFTELDSCSTEDASRCGPRSMSRLSGRPEESISFVVSAF